MAAVKDRLDKIWEEIKEKYTQLLVDNPESFSHFEAAIKIFSFLVAGRFENGQVISELLFSSSNLLVLLNDTVIKSTVKRLVGVEIPLEHLRRWLTVLEYIEVFLEIFAQRRYGSYGAWIFVTVVQIIKAVLKFFLLFRHGSGIQTTPPIAPVDRDTVLQQRKERGPVTHDAMEDVWSEESEAVHSSTFTLKRSGRQMRKLEDSPSVNLRTWELSDINGKEGAIQGKSRLKEYRSTKLSKQQLWGESLHIARPLAHLLSMYVFGTEGWKPWLVAAGMDVSSMCLIGDPAKLNPMEKAEMKRRTLLLLLYLLRTPFYDKYSRAKINAVLKFMSEHIPLARFIAGPILSYLPVWQRIYFYVWAT